MDPLELCLEDPADDAQFGMLPPSCLGSWKSKWFFIFPAVCLCVSAVSRNRKCEEIKSLHPTLLSCKNCHAL